MLFSNDTFLAEQKRIGKRGCDNMAGMVPVVRSTLSLIMAMLYLPS